MSFPSIRLQTPRLELISATVEMLQADLAGRKELTKALQVEVPEAWPPENWEREPIEFLMDWMRRCPNASGWFAWYCTLICDKGRKGDREKAKKPNTLLGGIGFVGPPNAAGETMVGYSLLSDYHRQGYCTEAIHALVDWAFSHKELKTLVIRTEERLRASIRVAEKLGFEFAGPGADQNSIEYVLCRAAWERMK